MTEKAKFTIITSEEPRILSKTYFKGAEGGLVKKTSAQMVQGRAVVVEVASLEELSDMLTGLNPTQALTYGIPPETECRIYSKKRYADAGKPAGSYSRTKEHFSWPVGAGVMFHDYDPSAGGLIFDRDSLLECIRKALTALPDVVMLWWTSSSSHICDGEVDLTGQKGQRIYWLVRNARDIERAAKAIQLYLWAAGYGYIFITRSGAMLLRTPLDASVYQSNRLDFAGGAACKPPLEQRRGKPVIIQGTNLFVDTEAMIPEPDILAVTTARENMAKAKDGARPEAEAAKELWIDEQVMHISDDAEREQARKTARRAVEQNILSGDYRIILADGTPVTVGEVLDDPEKYHRALTRDPVEPEYDGGKQTGILLLYGGVPVLHSWAHGGRTFKLRRQPKRIKVTEGDTYGITERTRDVMRNEPDLFDFGELPAIVDPDRPKPSVLEPDYLFHVLGGRIEYYKTVPTKDKDCPFVDIPLDPPMKVVKSIYAQGSNRRLNPLIGVLTAPTIRPDFSLLNKPGYDQDTGLLLAMREQIDVSVCPDIFDVVSAVNVLLKPFETFPFQTKADRTIMLCSLLTAAVRFVLQTAPAFAFDAPVQGSGKTLLARCVAIINTGGEAPIMPHQKSRDDDEIRKRLFAYLLSGASCLIWDNILGVFDSASAAAFLTSHEYSDRVLGKSKVVSVPNRSMLLMTGNNLVLAGDMPRRVLPIRIDPETETPFAREFDLDPAAYCLEHRMELVKAALTIIMGYKNLTKGRASGRMASFEQWDEMVRQPVCWLGQEVFPDKYTDPMNSVSEAVSADPELQSLGELLSAWHSIYGNKPVTAANVINDMGNDFSSSMQSIKDALVDLTGNTNLSSRGLGRVLTYRMGRIVNGLVMVKAGSTGSKSSWRVKTELENMF